MTALQPGEFIESIVVPKAKTGYLLKAYKISKRLEDDIAASCGAFNIRLDNDANNATTDNHRVASIRIAFGGMAEIPKRAHHCEHALMGKVWNEENIKQAMRVMAKDFTPLSDFRASADYRLKVSQNLLLRFYLELQNSTADNNNTHSNTDCIRVTHYA